MRKTIREDGKRLVLESEYLNDNALLEYVAEEGFMNVGVRYVKSPLEGIKEQKVLHMDITQYMKHPGEIIEINEGKDAIAVFLPCEQGYTLRSIYDTVEHQFVDPEIMDMEYPKKFPGHTLKGQYLKEKK